MEPTELKKQVYSTVRLEPATQVCYENLFRMSIVLGAPNRLLHGMTWPEKVKKTLTVRGASCCKTHGVETVIFGFTSDLFY